jgi:hypothetical protein
MIRSVFAGRFRWPPLCLGVALLLGTLGCVELPFLPHTDSESRQKVAKEKERDRDLAIRTIGDITEVFSIAPLPISGVGLVTGLNGTGGSPPPTNEFRKLLKDQLLKQRVKDVDRLIDSKDNAMVLVSSLIPAGSRRGDQLDIDVTLPAGSKATSLRGGFLETCTLCDYDTTQHIKPDAPTNKLLIGRVLAKARGPLLVGFGGKDDATQLRQGRIWAGSVCFADRPFSLILRDDQRMLAVANAVAQRINTMFQDNPEKRELFLRNQRLLILEEVTNNINTKFTPAASHNVMAKAASKESININVPYAYRFNAQRYLRVVRLIPVQEAPDKMEVYRRRLAKMLLDPTDTVRAALRLEALGKDSIPALKRGLESQEPLVRFAAAEALTYLGSTAGCEQLARLAEQYPLLRSYSLLALAGLEEAICRQYLGDMLAAPDAELRCGAFQALRILDETDKRLGGELLNGSFWLHRAAPSSTPLVFFAVHQRAEIVLFGSNISLLPGQAAKIMTGEFIIGADVGDDHCIVARFQADNGAPVRKRCSLQVDDILRTLADLGGQYADAVGFLTKADEYRCLSCPARCRTLPQEVSVETLAQCGKDPELLKRP